MTDAPPAAATTAPGTSAPLGEPTDAGPNWRADLSKLRRSRDDRKVAGVCGGVARAFAIDPLVLRVVLAVTAVFGAGLLVYGIAWLLIPDEGAPRSEGERLLRGEADGGTAAAVVGVFLGVALFGGVFGLTDGGWIGLVVLGTLVLVVASQRHGGTDPGPAAPAAAPTAAPGGYVPGPPPPPRWGPYAQPATGQAPAPTVVAPMPAPPRRPRSPLALMTLSIALLLAGGLVAGSAWNGGDGATDIDVAAIAAGVLCVLGAGLVVGSRYGRARSLIAAALVAAVVLVTAVTVSVPLRGGFGERYWAPTTTAALESPYRLVGGRAELDLRDMASDAGGRDVPITASVVAGDLVVIVPSDATVVIDSHVGFGYLLTPLGRGQTGADVHVRGELPVVGSGGTTTAGTGRLVLTLDVGAGSVEVRRAAS